MCIFWHYNRVVIYVTDCTSVQRQFIHYMQQLGRFFNTLGTYSTRKIQVSVLFLYLRLSF